MRALLHAVAFACALAVAAPAAAQPAVDPATQALFRAVELNDMAAVEKSLVDGADPMARNAQDQTPADLAVQKGHFKIAHFLLSKRNGGTRTAEPASPPAPETAPSSSSTSPAPAAPPAVAAERPAERPPSALLPVHPDPETPAPSRAGPETATAPETEAPPAATAEHPAMPETTTQPPRRPMPAPMKPEIATAPPPAPTAPARPEPEEPAAPPAVAAAPDVRAADPEPGEAARRDTSAPPAPGEEPGFWSRMVDAITPGFLQDDEPEPRRETAERPPAAPPREGEGTAERMIGRLGSMIDRDRPKEDEHGLPPVEITPPPEAAQPAEPAAPPGVARGEPAPAERPASPAPAPAEAPAVRRASPPPGATAAPPQVGRAAPPEEAPPAATARPSPPLPDLPPPGADPSLPTLPPLPGESEPAPAPSSLAGLPALPPLPGADPSLPPLPAPTPGTPTDVRKPLAKPPGLRPAPEAAPAPSREPPRAAPAPTTPPAPPASPSEPVEPKLLAGQEEPPQRTPQKVAIPDEPMQEYLSPSERVGRLGQILDREVERDPGNILERSRSEASRRGYVIGDRLTMPEGRSITGAEVQPADPAPATETDRPEPAPGSMAAKPEPAPRADMRPTPPAGPEADFAGSPASRLLDRFAGREEEVYAPEDEHGLPLAVPQREDRPAMAAENQPPTLPATPSEDRKLSALAEFFRADDPALGVRQPDGIRQEMLPAPDPGLIDTLRAESDPALQQTVPDSMLDLAPYTSPPEARNGGRPPQVPNPAFMDKLAEALTPEGVPVHKPAPEAGQAAGAGGEPGRLGIEQLDVPPDQLGRDAPVAEDPWTMVVEQAAADGEGSRTIAVKSIDPESGQMQPKRPDTGIVAGMMGRVQDLFAGSGDEGASRDLPVRIDDQERQETAERLLTEALRAERPSALPPGDNWPVTDVQTAARAPDRPVQPPESSIGGVSLVDVNLALGESVTLSNTVPPVQDGVDPTNECIKKNRATTLFCIEPVDWPPDIRATFVVPTILYTGAQMIARYDQGAATRFHALYPSDDYEAVVSYFQQRYGEPTDIWRRSIAPLAKPRQDNPTVAWQSRDSRTNAVIVLEVRKFDDTRGGFPDTRRGAVMLYYRNAPTIFPQVSSHELMRLRVRYE